MAKNRRKRYIRPRAAPAPPSGQGTANSPGGNPPPGNASPNTSAGKTSASPGIDKKIVNAAGQAVKAGAAEVKNTSIDGIKGTGRYISEKAGQQFHAKISEAEQDNSALETAHKAERLGEAAVRSGVRKGAKLVRGHLKKMGDTGKKKARNVGKQPAANLGTARQAAQTVSAVNLSAAANPAAPAAIIITGVVNPVLPVAPTPPGKTKLHSGAAPAAVKPSALRFSPPAGGNTSTLRGIWNTPAAQLGTHVDFSPAKPGLVGRTLQNAKEAGMSGLRMGINKAALQLHNKIDQSTDDNGAVKLAHQAEQFAERPAKYALKKGTNYAAMPVKTVSNKARSYFRHKYLIRKKVFLTKHQSIVQARGVVMKAKAITREVIRNTKPVLIGLFVCLLMYFFYTMVVSPIVAVVSRAGAEYLVTTTYPVANEDITGSTVQWKELEVALQQRIENIETEFPDFDEYRYDVDPMEHNPFELISYLAAMHLEFTHAGVQAEILAIFNEVNNLQLVEEIEIRYRTVTKTDSDGNSYTEEEPYEWRILSIILKPKPFEEVVTPRLEAVDAKDLYDVFMGSGGNQQAFGNPFIFNWSGSVTSHYGNRKNPTGPGYEFHTGTDIAAPEGTPIRTIQDGVVVVAEYHSLYGNYIVVRNEAGISSLYAHCSALYGSVGDEVRQGQIIAAVGSTGNSNGNHLHIEIKLGSERVNPLFYIQAYDE